MRLLRRDCVYEKGEGSCRCQTSSKLTIEICPENDIFSSPAFSRLLKADALQGGRLGSLIHGDGSGGTHGILGQPVRQSPFLEGVHS